MVKAKKPIRAFTPIRAFLYYLGRYLEADDKRRERLSARFKRSTGADLDKSTLWRHTSLRKEPLASNLLVYLSFLHAEGAIVPGTAKGSLFIYAQPDLLRAKK